MKKLLKNKSGVLPAAVLVALIAGIFAIGTPLIFGTGIVVVIKMIIDKLSTNPLLAVGVIVGLVIALKLFKK